MIQVTLNHSIFLECRVQYPDHLSPVFQQNLAQSFMMTLNLCGGLITLWSGCFNQLSNIPESLWRATEQSRADCWLSSWIENKDLIQQPVSTSLTYFVKTLRLLRYVHFISSKTETCLKAILYSSQAFHYNIFPSVGLSCNITLLSTNIIDALTNPNLAKFLLECYLGNRIGIFAHFKTQFWLAEVCKTD